MANSYVLSQKSGKSDCQTWVRQTIIPFCHKHTFLIDTCLNSIYWYNLGPVKKLVLHFFHEKKIHNPYDTPKPWPVCISPHIEHTFLLSDERGNCFFLHFKIAYTQYKYVIYNCKDKTIDNLFVSSLTAISLSTIITTILFGPLSAELIET